MELKDYNTADLNKIINNKELDSDTRIAAMNEMTDRNGSNGGGDALADDNGFGNLTASENIRAGLDALRQDHAVGGE